MSNATELLRRALEALNFDLSAKESAKVAEEIRAYLATEKEADPFADSIPKGVLKWNPEAEPVACKRCSGTGFIKTGEIDCYPDGTPYMNGPVDCIDDCPDCRPPRPEPARKPMTE